MVLDDADEMSAGTDKEKLRALIWKFLTEVCHYVGDFWYRIFGTGQGTLGLLFGAQDSVTFAEFLLLAGLAKTVLNQILFDGTKFKFVTNTCKITMPGIEQQTTNNKKKYK
jgi:hypothetical protein